jgi:hypothetical protein
MTDSEFRIPKSWAVLETLPKALEHWLRPICSKISRQRQQEFNSIGTKSKEHHEPNRIPHRSMALGGWDLEVEILSLFGI